jgi:hypothetical protein
MLTYLRVRIRPSPKENYFIATGSHQCDCQRIPMPTKTVDLEVVILFELIRSKAGTSPGNVVDCGKRELERTESVAVLGSHDGP